LGIDPLNDVDFSTIWPSGSTGPKGRPGATAGGHVRQIQDEKTAIVGLFSRNPDALSSGRIGDLGVFGVEIHGTIGDVDQSIGLGGGLGNILHVPVCGIARSPEIKVREEIVSKPIVDQSVLLGKRWDQENSENNE